MAIESSLMFDDCMSIIDGIAHTLLHSKFDSFCCVHVTQGASAAVNATMLLQIFLYPKGLVYIYFVIPVPAALMVRIFSSLFSKQSIVHLVSHQIFLFLLISGRRFDWCWFSEVEGMCYCSILLFFISSIVNESFGVTLFPCLISRVLTNVTFIICFC